MGIWAGESCVVVKLLLTAWLVTLSVVDVVHSDRVHRVAGLIVAATGE